MPVSLTPGEPATKPAGPSFSAPSGQRLKRQKGVKIRASCPTGCKLVLTGSVKVGAKKLKLTKVSRSLATGASAVLTLKVTDAKALRKAADKAKATIAASVTAAGATSSKRISVSLTS